MTLSTSIPLSNFATSMKKTRISKARADQEMVSEYRFDYAKAKPNRFAEKINLDVDWMVEMLIGEKKKEVKKVKPAKKKKK